MAKKQRDETFGFNLPLVIFVVFIGWGLWGIGVGYLFHLDPEKPESWAKAGQLGDLFGGINALATGLAFAMVWWTGHMQRKDLAHQMEELKLQRDELRQTRDVFQRQLFESSFFHQIELFRDISASANLFTRVGESGMRYAANECRAILNMVRNQNLDVSVPDNYRAYVNITYTRDVYVENASSLGPYFRTLYHLFKLIDVRTDLTDAEKIEHANLARAQLGSEALVVLAANILSELGSEFEPLVVRYGLLKHLPREDWFWRVERCIAPGAFLGAAERRALRQQ